MHEFLPGAAFDTGRGHPKPYPAPVDPGQAAVSFFRRRGSASGEGPAGPAFGRPDLDRNVDRTHDVVP